MRFINIIFVAPSVHAAGYDLEIAVNMIDLQLDGEVACQSELPAKIMRPIEPAGEADLTGLDWASADSILSAMAVDAVEL